MKITELGENLEKKHTELAISEIETYGIGIKELRISEIETYGIGIKELGISEIETYGIVIKESRIWDFFQISSILV